MNAVEVTRAELQSRVTDIIEGQASLAVVPHTSDLSWAAEVAWDLARSAAALGSSVTIIDLSLENPALDENAGESRDEGIVDTFLYGASLNHVSVRQPDTSLRYIGVGTFPGDPGEIWTSPRWPQTIKALSRPDSLIVFFVPEEALPGLNILLDGVIVASPSGYNPSSASASAAINSVIVSGTNLLAVVTGLIPAAQNGAPGNKAGEPLLQRFGRRVHLIYAIIAVVAVGSLGYSVLGEKTPDTPAANPATVEPDTTPITPVVAAPATLETPTPDSESPVAAPETATTPVTVSITDSLFWSVQTASLGSTDRVIEYLGRIESAGFVAAVTPVRLANGALWYRVLVGTEPDSIAATMLQTRLWATPLLRQPNGRVVRTPITLLLNYPDSLNVAARILALRENGIPAYILWAADGSSRAAFGAFRNQTQVRIADSILTASGITTTSINRLGNSQ